MPNSNDSQSLANPELQTLISVNLFEQESVFLGLSNSTISSQAQLPLPSELEVFDGLEDVQILGQSTNTTNLLVTTERGFEQPNQNQVFDSITGIADRSALVSDDQLVMNLTFEDVNVDVVNDSSPGGINNVGFLENGAFIESTNSFFDDVVSFDGVDDFVSITDSTDINLGTHAKRTLGLWFRIDELAPESGTQVLFEEGGSVRGLNIYVDADRLYVGGWNTTESDWQGTYLSTNTIQSGTWHHVALVLDAAPDLAEVQSGVFSAYLDGEKFGEGDGSQLWRHGSDIGLGAINQGTRFHTGTTSGIQDPAALKGSIGDIRLYNRALSAVEVLQLGSRPESLIVLPEAAVHLDFDEATGNIAADRQVGEEAQSGTLLNGASFQAESDFFGGAVVFDGVDDYVAIADSESINVGKHATRSIGTWFKVNSLDNERHIIYEEGGQNRGLNIYVDGAELYIGGWSINGDKWLGTYLSTEGISTDTWHHVALVLETEEGNNTLQAGAFSGYLDGVQFGSGDGVELFGHNNDIGLGAINQRTRFHDGAVNGTATYGLDGAIADFQLYNRALSAEEVLILATQDVAQTLDLSMQLVEDTSATGTPDNDGLTQNPSISGQVETELADFRLVATFVGQTSATDITELLGNDGVFTLTERDLENIFGSGLIDGNYSLTLQALDNQGAELNVQSLAFTLDRAAPVLELSSPIVAGVHSPEGRLVGSLTDNSEIAIATYQLDGGTPEILTTNGDGSFNLPLSVTEGLHQLQVSVTDQAGNQTTQVLDFSAAENVGVIQPTDSQGWYGTTATSAVLGEEDSIVSEAFLPVNLGQTEGSRTLSFDVQSIFDRSSDGALGDRLLVYLVDAANPNQTLLDMGVAGTPLFTLGETGAEFQPGIVRYNGTTVEIDVTSITDITDGRLVFQLLNFDGDTGSVVRIESLENRLDPDGQASPIFPMNRLVAEAGEAIALDDLSISNDLKAVFKQVRFDASTGTYRADLQVTNTGTETISRRTAIRFGNLPDGVVIQGTSGVDAAGDPYFNLSGAIARGGLKPGATSNIVEIVVENPNFLSLDWQIDVLSAGINQGPIFEAIAPITVTPGTPFELSLAAIDLDGDLITYTVNPQDNMPNLLLRGDGTLVFTPSPDELGSYSFTVTASDGSSSVSQEITVDVVADFNPTTRISGVILDVNGDPLAGVPIELGRISTLTEADGSFTLEIPDELLPTDSFDIEVPQGDIFFDPFGTGVETIEMRRAGFDTSTGTDLTNPRRHPNLVSGFLDGSMVYGSDQGRAEALRTLDGTGKLKTSPGDLLPFNNPDYFAAGMLENESAGNADPQSLFVAGDVRASENPALAALHTLLVREHNTLTESIASEDPTLTGEEIYQQARRVTSALVQKITYDEYLPLLLGRELSPYTGYDASVNPMASTLFSTSAFRIGHSQSAAELITIDASGNEVPLSTRMTFFNTDPIVEEGIDPILRGLSQQLAQEVDTKVIDELRNFLFGPPGAGGLDLVSLGIQRGRDLGLPSYNQARIDLGLAPVNDWSEITSNLEVQQALENTYGDVEEVDVWVGGLAEDHIQGGTVGSLFAEIIADQFERLRDGDRLWYENGQLTATELTWVEGTTLGSLIERHTGITGLGDSVFRTTPSTHASTTGYVATGDSSQIRSYDGSGNNELDNSLGSRGENLRVDFSLDYGDGISTPAGEDRLSARQISNSIFDQQEDLTSSIGATTMSVFWGQLIAHDLSLTPTGITTTLEIHGDDISTTSDMEYPFVAEKLSLVLGHDVYAGFNNVIERPIYLPALDIGNGQTIDPTAETIVTTAAIPGAAVTVAAGSLLNQSGQPFTGVLSITEVPIDLTPAALPDGLVPDMVVTIQPGDMVFDTPAPLSLPNLAGYSPGLLMDLWSINPQTGDFDIVGVAQVSEDGSVIETIEGGIRNSSWHFVTPPRAPITGSVTVDDGSEAARCKECTCTKPFSSEVDLDSGAVIESHDLVTYESLGVSRGVQLRYDSLRADPRPIVQFGYNDFDPNAQNRGRTDELRLLADLTIHTDEFDYQVPGFTGGEFGLEGGEHFWSLTDQSGDANASLQADLREFESGIYGYSLNTGIRLFNGGQFLGSSETTEGQIIHINERDSVFGAGWGIAGVQTIIENSDGSLLLIDGDGSELLFDPPTDDIYDAPPGDFSTLARLTDGTFQRTMKDQMVYQFDAQNRLVSVTDRNGNQTQHIYENDLLTKIIDPVGLETSFSYTSGKVTGITDPASRTTQFIYDAAGNLEQIIDPDETQRVFGYDDQHHMTSEIDKRGNLEQTVYNFAGRAIQGIQKDGSVIQVEAAQTKGLYETARTASPFDAPLVARKVTASYADQDGNGSETVLDSAGQTISSTDGAGNSGSIKRTKDNLIIQQIDARGDFTSFVYDDRGNVIEAFDEMAESPFLTNLAELNGINGFILNGVSADDYSGGSVSSAGDVNGDGIGDLIVGTFGAGGSYVVFGQNNGFEASFDLSSLDGSNGFVLNVNTDDYPSGSVSSAGDVNGDGIDDLIIGVDSADPNGIINAGESYVVFGQADDFSASFDLASLNVSNGFVLNGVDFNDRLGYSVSGAGDVNGDGIDDLIIGAYAADPNGIINAGASYVVFGQAGGFSASFNLSSLDGSNGFVLNGMNFQNYFGISVSSAGDVNGDGFDDFIIGASGADPNGIINAGASYVVFGQADDFSASFDLASLNGSNGFVLNGVDFNDRSGYSVSGAGDVNGDGIDDLIIGAYAADPNGIINAGASYVVFGQAGGFSASFDLSSLDGSNGFILNGLANYDESGYSVSGAGDVNGDGVDDLIIGASYGDLNGIVDAGVSYVVFGQTDGFSASFDLSFLDGSNGFVLNGVDADNYFGTSVSSAGDVNGDGIDDLIIGASGAGLNGRGASYVVFGQANGFEGTKLFTYESTFNQLTSFTDELGQQTLFDIDVLNGNILSETKVVGEIGGGDDQVTFYTYTTQGQVDLMTNPLGRVTDFDYDNLGLLEQITFAKGTGAEVTQQFDYDAAGNQILFINENGDRTEYIYDELNRLTQLIEADPDGAGPLESPVTFYLYDDAGNVTTVQDARGNATSFEYDVQDRLTTIADALLGESRYEYDNSGNIIAEIDERGFTTNYRYDSRDRLIETIDPEGGVVQFVYDGNNNLIALKEFTEDSVQTTRYQYDSRNRLTREIDAQGESITYEYDSVNNLTAITDRNGHRTEFRYDDLNRLIETEDALNYVTTQGYDLANNLTSLTDARGSATTYEYDERNRLSTIIHPTPFNTESITYAYDGVGNLRFFTDELGQQTEYQYDGLNRQTVMLDPLGQETQYTYDANDNLTTITDDLGRTTSFGYDKLNRQRVRTNALGDTFVTAYDATGNLAYVTDELNRTTTFEYDGRNLLTQVTDPLQNTTTTLYDLLGRVISETDALGRTNLYRYDELDRLVETEDAAGGIIQYVYDKEGNVTFVADELGRQTEYQYDALNRQTAMFDPLRHETQYAYDGNDNLTLITDALGRTTGFNYDERDRLTVETNALGDTVVTTYDAASNVTSVTDELNRTTTFGYDERNLLTQVTDPLLHTTTTLYDVLGRVVSESNALGHTTLYRYDDLDRLIESEDATGAITQYGYDAVGNLVSLVDGSGNETLFTFDDLDRLATESTLFGTQTFGYDAVGNQISAVDRNGREQSFEYDVKNRLTDEYWLDGTGGSIYQAEYEYNAASEVISAGDNFSQYTYQYDSNGQLFSVDNLGTPNAPNSTFLYIYDAVNNLVAVFDSLGGIFQGNKNLFYDDLNRPTQIKQFGSNITYKEVNFDYDAASQMTEMTSFIDGEDDLIQVTKSTYDYDFSGRLTDLTHTSNDNPLAFYQWEYDAANRVTFFDSVDGSSTYDYNERDELTTTDHSYQSDEAYSYDETGNRTNTGYETGELNRLLNDGTFSYSYDNEGNRETRTEIATGIVDEYVWDYRNRLTSITTKDSSGAIIKAVEYTYDVYDRRIRKVVDLDGDGVEAATTENFVYDGDHIALVFDENENLTHRYLHGPNIDQVLAEETADGEVRWAIADNQGTVRDVVDSDGVLLNHITYDSFGNITSETDSEVSFRFSYTGREFDEESGQYFYRARYYDAAIGRFINEDPIGFASGDTNIYRYVFNSPTIFIDPSGEQVFWRSGGAVSGGKVYGHSTGRPKNRTSNAIGSGRAVGTGVDPRNSFGFATFGFGASGPGTYSRYQIGLPDLSPALGLFNPFISPSITVAFGSQSDSQDHFAESYFELGISLDPGTFGGFYYGDFEEGIIIDNENRQQNGGLETRGSGNQSSDLNPIVVELREDLIDQTLLPLQIVGGIIIGLGSALNGGGLISPAFGAQPERDISINC